MQCPVCTDKTLVMSERQGIEIDYCPGCRGVWLDRGELDKILERSVRDAVAEAPVPAPRAAPAAPAPTAHIPPPPSYAPSSPSYHDHGYKHHKRKKSFLEELFD